MIPGVLGEWLQEWGGGAGRSGCGHCHCKTTDRWTHIHWVYRHERPYLVRGERWLGGGCSPHEGERERWSGEGNGGRVGEGQADLGPGSGAPGVGGAARDNVVAAAGRQVRCEPAWGQV